MTGNTFWLEDEDWDDFTAYEEAVNRVIGQYCMLVLCTYSLERWGAAEIMDVVSNHRFALLKRAGCWQIIESSEQALYGIALGANTAIKLFDTNRAKVREALSYVLSLAQNGLTEMRALIFDLRPESLKTEGLVAALTHQASALRARGSIEVGLSLCDEPDVSISIKEALYRIAQEALNNAAKHADPGRLDVHLACEGGSLELEVSDDGIGFDPSADYPGHLGLHSMRERAVSLGGTLDIVSAPGHGTQVRARVPADCIPPEETLPLRPG